MIFGYRDFEKKLTQNVGLSSGLVLDSNVLISATYELDPFHDETLEFLDVVHGNSIPLFCNVNARAEFLEIHRRIIFTEALIDIARRVNHSQIPQELNSKLNSLLTRARSSETKQLQPLRLSEKEIKKFKELMSDAALNQSGKSAWEIFCETQIKGKLGRAWQYVEDEIGVNFLSLRKEDVEQHIDQPPQWESVVGLIENHGLSSSDAMILNMFFVSKFEVLVTSDLEVALTFERIKPEAKICFVPDQLLRL